NTGNPNLSIWTVLGTGVSGQSQASARQAMFFGRIKPSLANGKNIGYIYLGNFSWYDPFSGLMAIDHFNPTPGNSPRPLREAGCRVLSEMTKYMNSFSGDPLSSIII